VVVTGQTNSGNFPVTPNAFQTALFPGCKLDQEGLPVFDLPSDGSAFVTKIAPDGGSLVFSTLFGGTCGSSGQAVAINSNGEIWIAGGTAAPDLPVTANALQPQFGGYYGDGFVARFSADGGLAYASYLGGPDYDTITGLALDRSGNVYLGGISIGLSQPASTGAFQPHPNLQCFPLNPSTPQFTNFGVAYVAKLNPDGSAINRLTYLGGGCASGIVVALDASGAPWVAGLSSIFPTVSPLQIAGGGVGVGVLAKLSPDFTQLTFSTNFDSITSLALDSKGSGYVAGQSDAGGHPSAYIARIDPTLPSVSLDRILLSGIGPNGDGLIVAPGTVLRLLGKNLGPASITAGAINADGFIATTVAGVEVDVGEVAAPLLSVSGGEIDCVVPFETAGPTTTISVQYNKAQSNPVKVSVAGTAFQVLNVFNENFTTNTPLDPAGAGSIMSVYIAGVGQTTPPGLDGQVNQAPFAALGTPIRVIDQNTSQDLPVTYTGAAPGAIAGVLQVNFFAPPKSSWLTIIAGTSSNIASTNLSAFYVSAQ
jgi:uncharacterized protein (TIGR03437 family)